MVEHVIPGNREDAKVISAKLGVEPLVVDAIDICLVRKPRLWWTNFDLDGPGLRWGEFDGFTRLFVDEPRLRPQDIDTGDWSFHSSVLEGKKSIPTWLTPAPTSQGRPAPQSVYFCQCG